MHSTRWVRPRASLQYLSVHQHLCFAWVPPKLRRCRGEEEPRLGRLSDWLSGALGEGVWSSHGREGAERPLFLLPPPPTTVAATAASATGQVVLSSGFIGRERLTGFALYPTGAWQPSRDHHIRPCAWCFAASELLVHVSPSGPTDPYHYAPGGCTWHPGAVAAPLRYWGAWGQLGCCLGLLGFGRRGGHGATAALPRPLQSR